MLIAFSLTEINSLHFIASYRNLFINNLSKIVLITLDQVQLKSVRAKFYADWTKSHVELEKVGFPVFAILQKNFLGASGRGHCKVIQLHSGNLVIQSF